MNEQEKYGINNAIHDNDSSDIKRGNMRLSKSNIVKSIISFYLPLPIFMLVSSSNESTDMARISKYSP